MAQSITQSIIHYVLTDVFLEDESVDLLRKEFC